MRKIDELEVLSTARPVTCSSVSFYDGDKLRSLIQYVDDLFGVAARCTTAVVYLSTTAARALKREFCSWGGGRFAAGHGNAYIEAVLNMASSIPPGATSM